MLNLLWLQSGGCGGCTMSLLNAESPDLQASLAAAGIRLLWHPSLSEASGSDVRDLLAQVRDGHIALDLLCIEGAVVTGPDGSGAFHILSGTGTPMMTWISQLAARARHVIAVGSCAAYGGITSGGSNPGEVRGLSFDGEQRGGALGADFTTRDGLGVINVAGCPPHPNWITETLLSVALGEFTAEAMDALGRPRSYSDHLVHHGCPRNEFYEYKASSLQPSDNGCLMENMGCIATQAHGDCNIRLWNGQGSCTRGGFACINCTAPEFEEPGHDFQQTPKLAGIPVGLPTDMPKAWFVALSSLSKAATPVRLKENARADHVRVAPKIHLHNKKR